MYKLLKDYTIENIPFDDEKNFYYLMVSSQSCGPCFAIKDQIESEILEDELTIYEIDAFKNMQFVENNQIRRVPTFIILDKSRNVIGKEVITDIKEIVKFYNEKTNEGVK